MVQPHSSTTIPPGAPRRHRGDRGLTTLEWLLIVAAVAGLAALAVVLVQNVVDDTAEQISGNSARLTAAQVAASEINEECDAAADEKATDTCATSNTNYENAQAAAKAKCERLTITYGDALTDANKEVTWFTSPVSGKKFDGNDVTVTKNSCHVVDA